MDSSDSEDHPGDDESAKYKYVKRGPQHIYEIIKYEGAKNICRFDHVLYNFGGSFIPAGQYSFPFSFKTGDKYPASFVVPFISLRTNLARVTVVVVSSMRCRPSYEDSTTDCCCYGPNKKS